LSTELQILLVVPLICLRRDETFLNQIVLQFMLLIDVA